MTKSPHKKKLKRRRRLREEKRRKETQELGQRRREKEQMRKTRRRNLYPEFVFEDEDADPDFVREIKSIISSIDFEAQGFLDEQMRLFYRAVKSDRAEYVFADLVSRRWKDTNGGPEAQVLAINLDNHMGAFIFSQLSQSQRERFFPFNNVVVRPTGTVLSVACSSLVEEKTGYGTFYHSRLRPEICLNDVSHPVAFTRHAIEQTCRRVIEDMGDYLSVGIAHEFFAHCIYFEPTMVRSAGTPTAGFDQPAFSLYHGCSLNRFHPQISSQQTMFFFWIAPESIPQALDRSWYYRVGYFPIKEVGEFFVAKTCLLPGFKKTREFALLSGASMDQELKQAMLEHAMTEKIRHIAEDWQPLRWFHTNGVPQVVPMDHDVFATSDGSPRNGGLADSLYVALSGREHELRELAEEAERLLADSGKSATDIQSR